MKKLLLFIILFLTLSSNAQLRLVKNHDGSNSSNAMPRAVLNGKLVYTATEAGINYPFITDGTTNNSSFIFDAITGLVATTTGTSFNNVVLNGEDHFLAFYTSTETGTFSRITKAAFTNTVCNAYGDLSALTGNANSQINYPVVLNNNILFAPSNANASNSDGIELYRSNGSVISLVKNINPTVNASSSPRDLAVLNSQCFFSADDGNGRVMWKTDGTTLGTIPYIDLNTSATIPNPTGFEIFGNDLIYAANPNQFTGTELYKTDGAGNVTLIRDIAPTTLDSSSPQNITVIDSRIYFSADNKVNGREVWVSNGTYAGTSLLLDINPSIGAGNVNLNSNPSGFTKAGGFVYFVATTVPNGSELWKTTGVAGTTALVKDINVGQGNTSISYMTEYNSKLYFVATDPATLQSQLWVSDGTASGTTMIPINSTGSSKVSNLIVYNNDLYFGADEGTGMGKELYSFHDVTLDIPTVEIDGLELKLFPNPTQDYFEIQSEADFQNVTIYSLQGQLVKSFEKQSFYIVSDLAKGIYLIKINGEQNIYKRFIKD